MWILNVVMLLLNHSTTMLVDKHHVEDSTLARNPKLVSDGEFEITPNEDCNEENPSPGDLEPMTKGKAQDGNLTVPGCLVHVTANKTCFISCIKHLVVLLNQNQ